MPREALPRVHVIGRRNHGKTSLVVDVVEALTARGLRVGTIKHTGHAHPVDVPGKDSDRHRGAGAVPVAFVTPADVAVFAPRPDPAADLYRHLGPHFGACDLVIVEGDQDAVVDPSRVLKIEVWRAAAGQKPIAGTRDDVHALVTDDEAPVSIPIWPRSDVGGIVSRLLSAVGA